MSEAVNRFFLTAVLYIVFTLGRIYGRLDK